MKCEGFIRIRQKLEGTSPELRGRGYGAEITVLLSLMRVEFEG